MLENYGGVVVSGGGRFLLREPSGHFGGVSWTFAKTQAKAGESPEITASRAVKEKTGYEALVRYRLSGAFGGASGPATWFLMEARHSPQAPNWQAKSIKWARHDEADDMIRLSANSQARLRALAILEAARAVVENIPFADHLIVHPVDWPDLKAMPRRHAALHSELDFDAREMERIGRGFVMHDMDATGSGRDEPPRLSRRPALALSRAHRMMV